MKDSWIDLEDLQTYRPVRKPRSIYGTREHGILEIQTTKGTTLSIKLDREKNKLRTKKKSRVKLVVETPFLKLKK